MFRYKNSLKQFDEAKYPYSMEFIKEGYYDSFHGECTKDGFNIMAGGAKHLFCTPHLGTFAFKATVTCSHYRAARRPLMFALMMGYDKVTRAGYEIIFKYEYDPRRLTVALTEIAGMNKKILRKEIFEDVRLKYNRGMSLSVTAENGKVAGSFGSVRFAFDYTCPRGRLGIDVTYVSGGILFADVQITSKEEVSRRRVFKRCFALPRLNGGSVPYTIEITADALGDGAYEMSYKLMGGSSSIPTRETHTNSWLHGMEDITDLYIRTIHKGQTKKYYLFNGMRRFLDLDMPKVHLNFMRQVVQTEQTPLKGTFYITDFPEDALLCVGYAHFEGTPYGTMEGASEHIFDKEGRLLYSGEPLEKEVVMSFVSRDKKIVKALPKSLWHYEEALRHAERNHYFYTGEKPKFELRLFSTLNFDNITVKVTLQDAYFTEIEEIPVGQSQKGEFSLCGYGEAVCPFVLPELKCGVYHVSAEILLYGGRVIAKDSAAFEVLDKNTEISPQEASGLPCMHQGDGGFNMIPAGSPNFYAEAPSCDFGHYLSIGLYPPIPTEEMRGWEVLSFYKRKMFIWPTKRTVLGYDPEKLKGVMSHADYIFPELPGFEDVPPGAPYRYDCFRYRSYGKRLRMWLNEFLAEHPDYRQTLGITDAVEAFTEEDLGELLKLCGSEWVDCILSNVKRLLVEQQAALKKKYPGFRRSGYAPWPAYFTPYTGGYAVKWFGYDISDIHEIYDGYVQLEDYPYSAAYRTTRSAWAVMTAKILNQKLKIHPELYFNFPTACPDLAIICAYPPFGESICPNYFTVTQMYEYVYSTAFFANGRFDYWRDYGFAPITFINDTKGRMRQILPAWKRVLENKPARPLKTTAFVYDINPKEDRFDVDIKAGNLYNISASNLSYLYDLMKANGIPGGFGVKFGDLVRLTEKDVSCVVLPDMTEAPEEVTDKLRDLHEKGVTLIAVSRTGALSELFGVRENKRSVEVNRIRTSEETENVFPNRAEFFHENVDGEVLLAAESGEAVVIQKENAILLNTAISQVGIDCLDTIELYGRANISSLLKKVLLDAVRATVERIAESDEKTGITLAETEQGDTLLVLTDYSGYDQKNREASARHEVHFYSDAWENIEYIPIGNDNIQLVRHIEGGVLKDISVVLRANETLLFKLQK